MSATIIPFPDPAARAASRAARADALAPLCPHDRSAHTEQDWFARAGAVVDRVEAMLGEGALADVVTLCERGMWCLLDAAPDIDDGDAVMALVDRFRALHLRACRIQPPDPLTLATFVYRLATSEPSGLLQDVIEPYLPLLGPHGVGAMRRLLSDDERQMRRTTGIARSILELRLRPIQATLARAGHPSAM